MYELYSFEVRKDVRLFHERLGNALLHIVNKLQVNIVNTCIMYAKLKKLGFFACLYWLSDGQQLDIQA